MTQHSTGFEIGYALGSVLREFHRALKGSSVVAHAQAPRTLTPRQTMPAFQGGPSAQELDALCQVPAIVRLKNVNLNDWYQANLHEVKTVQKPKRVRKPKATCKPITTVNQEPKRGSLDSLIAPVESLTC